MYKRLVNPDYTSIKTDGSGVKTPCFQGRNQLKNLSAAHIFVNNASKCSHSDNSKEDTGFLWYNRDTI